ncbi:MAG TPA: aminopeptidase P family protein [Oleiagrimonas sp.]|nr:aminopeptidase P family protein [Oleiagrimonas sp.]
MNTPVPSRIAALRDAMRAQHVAACLVPSADPHLSEYLPDHWQARTWLSGFDGSAGTLVVTADFAGLWTDSRYFEQAERQLADTGITLMRLHVPHTPEYVQWLCDTLGDGDTLAVAGDSVSLAGERRLRDALDACGASLRIDLDLPGDIWTDRPQLPHAPVTEHTLEYAITSRTDKLARVRDAMSRAGASHHLISAVDDIAWITNLRGSDVEYNPVFLSHLLIEADHCTLFVDAGKVENGLRDALAADGIQLAEYDQVTDRLSALSAGSTILHDPGHVVAAVIDALPASTTAIELPNPSTAMKAVKSDAELAHIRAVMREDGAALVHGFHKVEQSLAEGRTVTELDVASILRDARAARRDFVGESFGTIAGYMANGALPHYSATPERHSTLAADGLLLVDSGGQYLGGTTDITRVWAFGDTTDEQRRDCTAVLKGMIGLSSARFPAGASGPQLDALARAPLWALGADYGHGTGHGVGYFLNVHEGPQSVSPPRTGRVMVALEPGMISSIEPGLYKPGRHGIRHENLVVVRQAVETEFGQFHEFETITLCPIDVRAIEPDLLTVNERDWLNAYHARVERELTPLLDDEADRVWLHERCQALP